MLYLKRLKKDFYFRQEYYRNSIKIWKLKSLVKNDILSPKIRLKNRALLHTLASKRSKIHNKCLITGRSRGLIREFGISRIVFKKLVDDGQLSIIKK